MVGLEKTTAVILGSHRKAEACPRRKRREKLRDTTHPFSVEISVPNRVGNSGVFFVNLGSGFTDGTRRADVVLRLPPANERDFPRHY